MRRISAREFRQAASQLTDPVETRDGIFVPNRAPVYATVRGVIEGELAVVGWDPGKGGDMTAVITGVVPELTAKMVKDGRGLAIKPVPLQPLPAEARAEDPPFELPATIFGDPTPRTITAAPVRPAPKPSRRKGR